MRFVFIPGIKGGQFLFDLLECEHFILDGPSPPVIPTVLDSVALSRLAKALDQVKSHLDSAAGNQPITTTEGPTLVVAQPNLPLLEANMYLYDNVVLGVILSALPSFLQDRES